MADAIVMNAKPVTSLMNYFWQISKKTNVMKKVRLVIVFFLQLIDLCYLMLLRPF